MLPGSAQSLVLGIDIGTTSAKICLVDLFSQEVVFEKAAETGSDIVPTPQKETTDAADKGADCSLQFLSEQSVPKIWHTVNSLLDSVKEEWLKLVVAIGICGQQHGIVLWNSDACRRESLESDLQKPGAISHLITWQDQRCSTGFLESLPVPEPEQVLATGYGCCSLLWFVRNDPEFLRGYDTAGSVMDFFVWMLCDITKPVMSPQNAEAWGYFNRKKNEWNTAILKEAGAPVFLLPDIQHSSQFFAGTLRMPWKSIRKDVPVSVGMGDLQCSFVASLENENDAILNFSTSSQLTFIHNSVSASPPASCDVRSYFYERHLLCAPSLNGGNALQLFASMVTNWAKSFGITLTMEDVWKVFKEEGNSVDWSLSNDPHISPRPFGERYDTKTLASVTQIGTGNCNIGAVVRGILRGIISNLEVMIPKHVVHQCGINRIVLTGSLFRTFPQLKTFVSSVFELPTAEKTTGKDAAFGAAYITAKMVPS
ncbi:sedoheptulokinase-like [Paramacrobiotus metropolitanus]|uniref:sedoheptulokinase-like n=1 Tax=Paramacrobiotus metropolitanus TaxID=2943436 RepID=UPI002445B0E8|nr:sedoheptulokinase-like [Paramacrobiotus metropolitanus]